MRNLHADMLNITAKRRAARTRARRIANVARFVSDGVAMLATLVLIGALCLLLVGFQGFDACALGDLRWLACG